MYWKEEDGRVHNSIMQVSGPWWSSVLQGSQAGHGDDHDDQLKSFTMHHPVMDAGQTKRSGSDTFTLSCGNGQKTAQPRIAVSEQSAMAGSHPRIELAYAQQMICAKYPYVDQCYGLFSAYGPQLAGRIMLPISMTEDEGPIYVNAKQYHGIIRRRKSRAKAEMENKIRRARKPYLHESRHRHAMRRARGIGGRFLGTKNSEAAANSGKSTHSSQNGQQVSQPTASLNSDSKDTNGSSSLTLSGPEVTSTFPRGDFDLFQINSPHPSLCSLSNTIGGGDRMVMPHHKWYPAAGNCCNLKV